MTAAVVCGDDNTADSAVAPTLDGIPMNGWVNNPINSAPCRAVNPEPLAFGFAAISSRSAKEMLQLRELPVLRKQQRLRLGSELAPLAGAGVRLEREQILELRARELRQRGRRVGADRAQHLDPGVLRRRRLTIDRDGLRELAARQRIEDRLRVDAGLDRAAPLQQRVHDLRPAIRRGLPHRAIEHARGFLREPALLLAADFLNRAQVAVDLRQRPGVRRLEDVLDRFEARAPPAAA